MATAILLGLTFVASAINPRFAGATDSGQSMTAWLFVLALMVAVACDVTAMRRK